MGALREIAVIGGAELGRTLRSGRVVALLCLYFTFALISGLAVHGCAAGVRGQAEAQLEALAEQGADPQQVKEAAREATERGRRELIRAFFSDDEALTEALLATPLVLLIVYKLSLFFLPLYVGLMGFDQLSGELGPRSIRYLAVRARRASVLWGKLVSQATLLAALMLLVNGAFCLYGLLTQEDFSAGKMLLTLARFWSTATLFSVAYLSLTTLCSALSRQPALSLMNNVIALFLIWLAGFLGDPPMVGKVPMFEPVPYLKYASLWYYRTDLLHPEPSRLLVAIGGHLGFALLFLGLGQLVLKRRDL